MPRARPRISELARDVTEFLGSYDMGPPKRWSSLRVAYHSACSHAAWPAHHRRAARAPAQSRLHAWSDVPEGHICCGSAGTYNILQPEIAARAARPQGRATSAACKPDVVATGNIGCITQLAGGSTSPSCTPWSCSTGPTAAPCRAGSKRSPASCPTCRSPSAGWKTSSRLERRQDAAAAVSTRRGSGRGASTSGASAFASCRQMLSASRSE